MSKAPVQHVKTIQLTQGQVALVDDKNYNWLNQHKWSADKRVIKGRIFWYARRKEGKRKVYMHREIAAVAGIAEIDHRDGDGLNNQEENLRPAQHAQNACNRRKADGCTSKSKGVSWDSRRSKWRAYIAPNGHQKHLGYFDDEIAATKAHDAAATSAFGQFARTNL